MMLRSLLLALLIVASVTCCVWLMVFLFAVWADWAVRDDETTIERG